MTSLPQIAEPVADDRLKLICMHCGSAVPHRRRGWAATCLACDPEPTADDWRDYDQAAEALDAAWLADVLDAEAALDEPDPAMELDLDARYGPDYDPAEYAPLCGIGHPATED